MVAAILKAREFLIPVVASLVATPLLLGTAFAYAGAGHGSYLLAKVLFPLTMLSSVAFSSITAPFIILAIAQFPAYGLLLGRANLKGKLARWAIALTAIHLMAVCACNALVSENFS